MRKLALLLPVMAMFAAAFYLTRPRLTSEQAMVDFINSSNGGWTATTYPGMHFSLGLKAGGSQLNDKLGLKLKSFSPEELKKSPDSFDSREAWPDCSSIRAIRNQSKCGSCWAFSAATVMSDRLCIGSNQKIQTRLSPEDVLACCYSCGNGCDGGFPNAAWDYFMQSGIVSGDNYGENQWCKSYSIPPDSKDHVTPDCKRQCTSNQQINYFTNKTRAQSGYILVGEEAFKAEISQNGPISASFSVYADFRQYKSGVYWHQTGEIMGGHAIRIVGYGEEGGVKYWLIANTWSPTWGDNGFFKIRRGNNECGIEAEGLAGLVNGI